MEGSSTDEEGALFLLQGSPLTGKVPRSFDNAARMERKLHQKKPD
jgi:hypothetical protein